jgi:putative alpha-1,2-mannosidase
MFQVFITLILLVVPSNVLAASLRSNELSQDAPKLKLKKLFTGKLFEEECGKITEEEHWLETRGVEEFVNILGGTNSRYDISHGSTLPLITRPWGFNSYAPMTDDDPTWPGWWFHPSDRRFFGMRVTHQPSPWIRDYGNFLIKAYMPAIPSDPSASKDKFTGYSPYSSEFHPYYFSTNFLSYGNSAGNMKFELTPSLHGGIIRVTFPKYIKDEKNDDSNSGPENQIRRIAIALSGSGSVEITTNPVDGAPVISGFTSTNSGGVGDSNAAFAHFFALAIYNGATGDQIPTARSSYAVGMNGWIDFNPENADNDVLIVRFATSFISKEQAIQNLKAEVPSTKSFDSLLQEAQSEWRNVISRIKITEPPVAYDDCELRKLYSIFYTSVYRASIFPRQISEVDASGNLVHWSPYATSKENRVMPGALSTDSGFWDAWNTIYPLLALYHRPYLGTSIQGWVNAYAEGGAFDKH